MTTGYGFYERLEVSRRDVAVKIVEIMRLGYSLGSCQLCVGQFASLVCLGKMPQIYKYSLYVSIAHTSLRPI